MKRLALALAVVGALLGVYALRIYGDERQEYNFHSTLCALDGADCTASMTWQPTLIAAGLAVAALVAASVVSKRAKNLVD